MYTINCKGKIINLEKPIVMGIINATPDSFYKSDLDSGIEGILKLSKKMLADGASILDIGGQSTKPNAVPISAQEEIDRVIPVIEALHNNNKDAIISIDTFNSRVAQLAVGAGASMVNDVSCGEMDIEMINVVGTMGNVPYIGMHKRGTAATMQSLTYYENIIEEIKAYLEEKKQLFKNAGVKDFILDPGFGFAKTVTQNFTLLKNLSAFKSIQSPLLIGVSRKSSIYKTLAIAASEALNGTTVLNTLAINNGANILRVHDVKEAVEVIKLMDVYKDA